MNPTLRDLKLEGKMSKTLTVEAYTMKEGARYIRRWFSDYKRDVSFIEKESTMIYAGRYLTVEDEVSFHGGYLNVEPNPIWHFEDLRRLSLWLGKCKMKKIQNELGLS
ncbi:unnamed protein product [Calypogeia fissa]